MNLTAAHRTSLRPTFKYKLGERFKARLPVKTPENLHCQKLEFLRYIFAAISKCVAVQVLSELRTEESDRKKKTRIFDYRTRI